jgi:hypothetical protein
MKILIITNDTDLIGDHLSDLMEPYRCHPDQSFTLVSVVEPSHVVDMSLSIAGGHCRPRQIMEERLLNAQAQLDEASRSVGQSNVIDLSTKAIVGSVVPVTVQTATELQADLVLLKANTATRDQIKSLLSQCPCSVAIVKPRRSQVA